MTRRATTRWVRATVVVAPAATAALAMPTIVTAASSACVQPGFTNEPTSCVQVQGTSTFVQSVAGGVLIQSYHSSSGHFHVYGGGLDFTSPDALYENRSFKPNTKYGPSFPVNHQVPDGSRVCANFLEAKGGGYITHAPACVTVHT